MKIPILIIGAGPAGLSTAYELRQKGLPAIIVDSAPKVGSSWRLMPTQLSLISPWKDDLLPGDSELNIPQSNTNAESMTTYPTKDSYISYLESYATRHGFQTMLNTKVVEIHRENSEFKVTLEDQTTKKKSVISVAILVNATGYFSNPYKPHVPGLDQSQIPSLHFANYKNPQYVYEFLNKKKGKVLIIGKRISSGQAMLALHNFGFQVSLSTRSGVEFMPSKGVRDFFSKLEPYLAKLSSLSGGRLLKGYRPPMEGGQTEELIRKKLVKVYPNIKFIENNLVHFEDGSADQFDLILFATGFHPSLSQLQGLVTIDPKSGVPIHKNGESTLTKNLFMIGIEDEFNFRSRFIRGFREDAAKIAELISLRKINFSYKTTLEEKSHPSHLTNNKELL